MGTTLASYHVYGQPPEAVLPLLDKNEIAVSLSEGWTSVLSRPSGCELSDKPAKKLSKALDAPVLSFLYFDDDLMSLTFFHGGKLCAQYRMDEGAEPYLAHVGAFAETLGWDKSLASRLKRIFGCSDMEDKVAMLEEFFGVALRVDAVFLEDGAEAFVRQRGDTLCREYEAKQKKLSKIKNKTRVVLTQEIDAKLSSRKPCIAVRCGADVDIYDPDMGEMLELVGDELRPMLGSFRLPGFDTHIYPCREGTVVTNGFGLAGLEGNAIARVNRRGNVLAVVQIPANSRVTGVLENGDMLGLIFPNGGQTTAFRFGEKGKEVWRIPFGAEAISIGPVAHDKFIYCGGSSLSRDGGTIYKLDEDGHIVARLSTTYINNHSELLFDGGLVYYLGETFDGGWNSIMLKLDETLHIVETIAAPKGLSIYSNAYFGRRRGRIYYNALDKQIVRFDLAVMRCTVATTEEQIYLSLADEDGFLYGVSGLSTLCVLDSDMKLVSRHRLKGAIFDICRSETGVHALTATGDMAACGFPEPPCYVRVYRIDPA